MLILLNDLRRELGLTYVFISLVRYISDRVLVMYLCEVVEVGPAETIYHRQAHPYTASLFAAIPSMDPDNRTEEPPLAGDPPNPVDPPLGCRFHTRCRFSEGVCSAKKLALAFIDGDKDHLAACHMRDPASGHSLADEEGGA